MSELPAGVTTEQVLQAATSGLGLPEIVRSAWGRQEFLTVAVCEILEKRRPKMALVEYELRRPSSVQTSRTHRVWAGARAELRRRGIEPDALDIASEAIEAAEALRL